MSSGSPILLKIVSENRFSGKTYFIQFVPDLVGVAALLGAEEVDVESHDVGGDGLRDVGHVFRTGTLISGSCRSSCFMQCVKFRV